MIILTSLISAPIKTQWVLMLVFCSYPPFVSVQGRLVRLKEGNDIDNGIHRYVHIALHIYKVTFHHCHSWQTKHYNHFIVEWHIMQWKVFTGKKILCFYPFFSSD